MDENDVFSYIRKEEVSFRTVRVPLTNSKSWNMSEHIERCTNVANGWFNRGSNEDGLRPYSDIVTPIIDVAFRSEGFDVKDIVPFVDDSDKHNLSFIVKKFHPQWARKHELDTFIDEVVETSIIYDLALVKDINGVRPEVVDLKTIAFCDQTNVMAGPICIRHQYTISELVDFKGKWDSDKIDQAIVMALEEKKVALANDQAVKTPSKYIEVYELRGHLPERWLKDDGEIFKYSPQMHIVCYYTDKTGAKNGITLFKGADKPLSVNFKALKIDQVRSKGRACGRSIVERLFEAQVWKNYSAIKIKAMLDSSINLLQTDSEEFGNQKISDLKHGTILKHEPGRPISRIDMQLQNLPAMQNFGVEQENSARTLGSASEASLGKNPVSGTPFALQQLIVQQGEGVHEYRRGKVATFFADVLYRDLILKYLIRDLNKGEDFSEVLSLDEMQEIVKPIAENYAERQKRDIILSGQIASQEELDALKEEFIKKFMEGDRKFFKEFKDAFTDIPVRVFVNVAGKQKNLAADADKISNMISFFLKGGIPVTALAKPINELLEKSGMSPINFSAILAEPQVQEQEQPGGQLAPVAPQPNVV